MPERSSPRKYKFHRQAREEFLAALRAYRQEEIEAGQAFATEVRHSIDLLLRHPEIAPAIGRKHVRRKVLRRFPYSLFYVIEPDRSGPPEPSAWLLGLEALTGSRGEPEGCPEYGPCLPQGFPPGPFSAVQALGHIRRPGRHDHFGPSIRTRPAQV